MRRSAAALRFAVCGLRFELGALMQGALYAVGVRKRCLAARDQRAADCGVFTTCDTSKPSAAALAISLS